MAFDPSKGGFSALRGAVSKTHLGFQGRNTKKKKQNASFFVVLMTYMLNLLDIIGYINVC